MASQTFDLSAEWRPISRYTAESERGVLISNLSSYDKWMGWAITKNDEVPGIAPSDANPIRPGRSQPLTLALGERLWLAMMGGMSDGRGRVQE